MELFESNYNTSLLLKKREEIGEKLFNEMEELNGEGIDLRAIAAILTSAMYHLGTFSAVQQVSFCGIDLREEKGRKRILEAMNFLIDTSLIKKL